MKNKQSGFLQLIAAIIIFVVIVLFIGKSPIGVWTEYIKPVLISVLAFFVQAIEFLINLVTTAWEKSH